MFIPNKCYVREWLDGRNIFIRWHLKTRYGQLPFVVKLWYIFDGFNLTLSCNFLEKSAVALNGYQVG